MESRRVFSTPVIILIGIAYATSGYILWREAGPWESIRQVGVNGLLLAAWLMSASKILGDEPVPPLIQFRRPGLELFLLLAALLGMMVIAAANYLGLAELPLSVYLLISVGTVLLLHLFFRYPAAAFGLNMPSRRAWLALLVIIGLNFLVAGLFQVLPEGEAATPQGADLAQGITGPFSILALFGGLLLRAALPEEVVLRVGLQSRMVRYLGVGLAILVQALLFSSGHLPQQLFRYNRSLPLAIAYLLPIENGLIAGYLWYRSRSLPLQLILHLFAFPRLGN